MADRFPSLEEFDSGAAQLSSQAGTPGFETASGDDFLSREKALLGDDADQFATGNDNAAFVEDGDDDLLGGGGSNEEVTEFESSYPAIDTRNENVAPGGTITGTPAPFQSSYQAPYAEEEEEPEVIKQWRERRDLQLQSREEKSEERKAETIKAAQQNIDDFYENYNSKKEKMIAQTRREAEEFLESREDTSAGGTSWERIAKLVDLSGKGARGGASGTGKEKFRELLISLKKDEKAPGVTGY
ncbi:Clathrin light chain [Venustampulla echinocandica]|uniref:Clathrin light chain n=1 Tax=Venustampulla echinocandica TaxID=2656787 RepID=A0A370TGK8_9HELO|nr:Clathrin light chain [Venustampulla echinocandica]RDL34334.1 Clathrin light chain [Venustampulla echinocandica]